MSYLTANDRPGAHAPSWYAETAGPLPEFPALDVEARADVCVIGGGYAGLSAALHLAERGVRVVLVEANRIGWGASGRNGGQLGTGPRAEITEYERLIGPDDAAKIWEIAISANGLVRELIARHGIACDLADGYVEACWRASDVGDVQSYAELVADRYGHDRIRTVGRAEMAEMLGTDRYHGGFLDMAGAHLHPLKLALGLGRAAVAAGAVIHENSRVLEVGEGCVRTASGEVRADRILLACNGYLDGLSTRPQRHMLPINNFVLATEPLGARGQDILRDNVCVADTRFVLNYFRRSPDGRLIWGGGESYGKKFPSDLKGLVRKRMLEIYPALGDVGITHAWGGTLAITGTRFPLFQELDQGVMAIGGWSGSGIHMATMGGRIAAEMIGGERDNWDLLARLPTPQFPGGDWFRLPLLRLAMTWYALRDRL